jgi:hypothetical protein
MVGLELEGQSRLKAHLIPWALDTVKRFPEVTNFYSQLVYPFRIRYTTNKKGELLLPSTNQTKRNARHH